MEVRERHNLSRGSQSDTVSMDPNAMPNTPVYKTRASRGNMKEDDGAPVYHEPDSKAWEGEIESEEILDGSYGSREKLTKKELMNSETWMFPVRPVFPNDDDSDDDDEDDMVMMTSCCCCFSTKNGSIAVGIICLIISFILCVIFSFALINVDGLAQIMTQIHEASLTVDTNGTSGAFAIIDNVIGFDNLILHLQTILIVLLVFYALYTFSSLFLTYGACTVNLQTILIVLLVFYALYTFSSLFLTYGACTNLRSLLMPWIVLEFGPFAAQLAGIIFLFVYGKDDEVLSKGGTYIIAGLLQIIAFVIHVYWWMCPVAHFQSLKEDTEVETLVPNQPQYPGRLNKY
ncbi:hypothetical protein FHG87_002167 [Trinorchestia longiramus]|nr:hypothetical protein FHG87_002167 [Trinorchestia longiramus]